MLADELLAIVRCPVCHNTPLWLDIEEKDGDIVARGTLNCRDCKRWYRVTNDIPSLMPQELGSSLRAADTAWARWRLAMDEFLQWRDGVWSDPQQAEERRRTASERHRRFLEFCELPADQFTCLDVGSGTGHLADLLGDNCTYVGIDPLPGGHAPDSAELPPYMPRPQRPVSLVQGVGEALPFVNECFDVVLIVGSLDHCNDPDATLSEARRVLTPGGRLGLLLGVNRPQGGFGGVLRSLTSVFTLSSGVDVRATHMFSFTMQQLRDLVARHFKEEACVEDSGRAFIRAVKALDVTAQ